MRNISIPILFFAVLLIEITSFGADKQDDEFLPGYVVTSKGDTIQGSILIKDHFFNTRNCFFKQTESSTPKQYLIEEVSAYGIKGKKYFKRATIKSQSATADVFLECIISGSSSLFSFEKSFFLEHQGKIQELSIDKRMVTKENRTFAVNVNTYRSYLQEALNDCQTIHSLISSSDLTRKDLKKIFLAYYACNGQPFSEFESDNTGYKVNFNLAIGTALSSVAVSGGGGSYYFLDGKGPTFTYPIVVNFLFEFSQISIKDKFKVRTGLVVFFSNNKLIFEQTGNLIYDLTIDNIRLELPIVARYNLGTSNKGFYLVGGFGLNTFLKWDENLQVKVYSTGYVVSDSSDLHRGLLFPSLMGGTGYNFAINNRNLFVEADYNGTQILNKKSDNSPTSSFTNFGIRVGMSF
jgi:hypothetical protein